jgi:DNA helicase II / ATP-dependent DNA helicase PcrA
MCGASRIAITREKEIPTTMRNWSTYQLAVFDNVANGTGHTVVNAVAGSGKTTTIEEAVKHVPRGKRVLFVAFNKAIEEELGRRLSGQRGVETSTLHSYGLRIVSANLGRLRIDKRRLEGIIETAHGSTPETYDMRRDLGKIVSLAKGMLLDTPEQIDALIDQFGADSVNGNREQFIKDVLAIMDRCKDVSDGTLDFDDMVWLPIVKNLTQLKYDRVFVDETQDLNAAQIELVMRAVTQTGRILAVGDPRQAIYRFRGADENAFTRVKERLGALELPLSVCYRCAKTIVWTAKELVPAIEAAPDAERGEVRLASYGDMWQGVEEGDFVLSRSNAPLVRLCLALLKDGRRANIQGRDMGRSLKAFVKKSRAKTVAELREYVGEWEKAERERLAKKRRDAQAVEDKAACILTVSDGAASIQDVLSSIDALFEDKDDKSRIILSTTHKAKGLERERVWVLATTYRRRPEPEETALYYVAITRARKVLVLVEDLGRLPKQDEE